MSSVRISLLIAACALAACSSGTTPGNGDAGPCGACPAGQGCDVANKACAPGVGEGSLCGPDAPVGQPSICVDGFQCGFVAGGTNVCTRTCSGASDCAMGQSCYQAMQNGTMRNYCATPVGIGSACGPAQLKQCTGSNGLLAACIQGADGGLCMQRCDRNTPCPSGQACSEAFSDGAGVCGMPTTEGSRCDQSTLQFCNAGQVCVEEAGTAGVCHLPCGSDGDGGTIACPSGEDCIYPDPCAKSGIQFCVHPQAIDADCAPANDHFCGAGTVCVSLQGSSGATIVCKQDCTGGGSCSSGTCNVVGGYPDGGRETGTCGSACY